jgi:outer membrane receptor protein involved in Fe transport
MKLRLIACAAVVCARAYAQETPPIVQVKASADTLRQQDTAARIVVTRDELLKYGDPTVLDALKRLPGVSVVDNVPRMRGLGAGYTQVLVDGSTPPPGFALENLSPEMIEKIEVVRSAVAEYSTRAIAGTINVVLRKPASKPSSEWRASLGGAPSRSMDSLSGTRADKAGDMSYTVSAALSHGRLHSSSHTDLRSWDASGSPLYWQREDQDLVEHIWNASTNARMSWKLAPGRKLDWSLRANYIDNRSSSDGGIASLFGPENPLAHMLKSRVNRMGSAGTDLGWSVKLDDGSAFETTLKASAVRALRHFVRHAYTAGGELALDRVNDTSPTGKSLSWKGKYSKPLATGHIVSAGWDTSYTNQGDHELQFEPPLPLNAGDRFDREYHSRLTTFSAFLQDEWEVNPNLSVYGGVRREAGIAHSAGSDFPPISSHSGVTSPLLQALLKIPGESKSQLRAALARTYKLPPAYEFVPRRGTNDYNSPVSPDYSGNPNLRPEISHGLDLAWEYYWTEGALLSLSAGARRIKDAIVTVTEFDGARWVSSPHNIGKARSRSLEIELKFPYKDFRLSFNAGRHFSSIDNVPGPNNRLGQQSPWTGNFLLDYGNGSRSAGANLALSTGGWSRVTPTQSSYSGVQRSVEAYVGYKIDAASKIRLTALNLAHPAALKGSQVYALDGRSESMERTPGRASLRLNYERRF